jgi:hypothetical protein
LSESELERKKVELSPPHDSYRQQTPPRFALFGLCPSGKVCVEAAVAGRDRDFLWTILASVLSIHYDWSYPKAGVQRDAVVPCRRICVALALCWIHLNALLPFGGVTAEISSLPQTI